MDGRSERRDQPPPSSNLAAPWLVIPFQEVQGNKRNQAFYNISQPNNKSCRKSIPELSGNNVFYQKPSHQGWLVIRCDESDDKWRNGVCFLWNPLTFETVQLPNLEDFLHTIYVRSDDYFCIHDSVLSSPPPPLRNSTSADLGHDSMVYFLVLGGSADYIVYCRVGDANWRMLVIPRGIVADSRTMSSLICFKGKVYVMCGDDNCQLVIEKLRPSSGDYGGISLGIRGLNVTLVLSEFPFTGGYAVAANIYFLESYEEIYRIEMVCLDRRGYLKNLVILITISRLDFSEKTWKKVNSLGDTVLFLGKNTNACCSAAELGLNKGCLYYTLPKDQNLYMYDVEDKCITTILPCSKLPTTWFSSQWIRMPLPTFSATGGGSTTEKMLSKVRQHDSTISDDFESLRIKQNEEDLEQPRPWVVVNEDIVNSIAGHLHPVDFLHFRAVCKTNKVPIPKQISGPIRSTYITPWLVFSTENGTRFNLVDPLHNEKYFMNLPKLLSGATIRGQKGGWLLMSKGTRTLFFYNPFTKQTIQLPKQPFGYGSAGITFSSVPTCSDCKIFGITQQNDEEISMYTTMRGSGWCFHMFPNSDLEKYMPTYNQPVFHKGAFYCLDFNGTLGVFNDSGSWKVLKKPRAYSNAAYVSFLVDCADKLFLVQTLGTSVTIFRLDSLKMVWRKVTSLGKYMFFIDFRSCVSAVAPKSWMENKVYFPRLQDERIIYYSLETGSYHAVGSTNSAEDYVDTKRWTNCTWIEPNWSRFTPQELDWLNKNPR